jgi:hypothetical protein
MSATWQLLSNAERLAAGYSTGGPILYEFGQMEMSVIATSGFRDPGTSWIEAAVQNLGPQKYPGPRNDQS